MRCMVGAAVVGLTWMSLIVQGCGGGRGGGGGGPAQTFYAVTDLGTLGGTESEAEAINEAGHVVGGAATAGDAAWHAFIWDGATMTDLGTLGGTDSMARAINASDVVVGYSDTPGDAERHAFIHDGAGMTDLTPTADAFGLGINDAGLVVGSVGDRAFAYDGSTIADLGTLGGATSAARGVNNVGQIAGSSRLAGDATYHAFRYVGGIMSDIGTLGGDNSIAYAINAHGHVVGRSETAAGDGHAFLYDGANMTDLGSIGGTDTRAYAINDNGLVVGSVRTATGDEHALVHDGAQMIDLNDRLAPTYQDWTLSYAYGINNAGWIVGGGISPSGQLRAFLATPL